MRDQIKYIVEHGGLVHFSHKVSIPEWMGNAQIFFSDYNKKYTVQGKHGVYNYYDNLDKAIDAFISLVFSKKNYALAIKGIRKYKLTDKDLDDVSNNELKKLCKLYFNEYYDKDYGDIK